MGHEWGNGERCSRTTLRADTLDHVTNLSQSEAMLFYTLLHMAPFLTLPQVAHS